MRKYTDLFIQNSWKVKEEIEKNSYLMSIIHNARKIFRNNKLDPNKISNLRYVPISETQINKTQPNSYNISNTPFSLLDKYQIGIKMRKSFKGLTEIAIMADTHLPKSRGLLMPSFGIIIDTKNNGESGALYIIEHLGKLEKLDYVPWAELESVKCSNIKKYHSFSKRKGYEFNYDSHRIFEVIPGTPPRCAIIDLCLTHFNQNIRNEIMEGTFEGTGNFKRLKNITSKLPRISF